MGDPTMRKLASTLGENEIMFDEALQPVAAMVEARPQARAIVLDM
jgi:hypothetical protein